MAASGTLPPLNKVDISAHFHNSVDSSIYDDLTGCLKVEPPDHSLDHCTFLSFWTEFKGRLKAC